MSIIVLLLPTAAGMKSLQLFLIYLTKYSHYRIDIIDYYYINIFEINYHFINEVYKIISVYTCINHYYIITLL